MLRAILKRVDKFLGRTSGVAVGVPTAAVVGAGAVKGAGALLATTGAGTTVTGLAPFSFISGVALKGLAFVGVTSFPPLLIGVAVVLALPAILGGFYEAYKRIENGFDKGWGWGLLAIVLSPINILSGFLRTTWSLLCGKGYFGSVAETVKQVKAEIAREEKEGFSILGSRVPKTVDRLVVGPVVGFFSGLVGGLRSFFSPVLPGKGLLVNGVLGTIAIPFRLVMLPFRALQGMYRGVIAGSDAAYDTAKHIHSGKRETEVGLSKRISSDNTKSYYDEAEIEGEKARLVSNARTILEGLGIKPETIEAMLQDNDNGDEAPTAFADDVRTRLDQAVPEVTENNSKEVGEVHASISRVKSLNSRITSTS